MPDLLRLPHHDGSPAYVENETPRLGETVTIRMRSHPDDPLEEVWLRTTYDAEPVYQRLASTPGDGETVWWSGDLLVHNPVSHYRFLLVRTDGRQLWLTGNGLVEIDVPDAADFKLSSHTPAPDWARDGVVYQIFPDRFGRSHAADDRPTPPWALPASWSDPVIFDLEDPRTAVQLFGGDLDGIVERLEHLERVGADIVYTTPVFPGESNHRYNATTFDEVDPLLGGDAAYERLSTAVHQRGWRILGDLTTNHTGDTHEWFRTAQADPESGTRSFYYFNEDGSYADWMGFATLPKVNHGDPDLRSAMVEGPDSVVGRWLRPPYDVDGWRIDVANMTGRLGPLDVANDVARAIRRTCESLRENPFVIGEHNHDASGDVDGDGWHATMNYSGFSWPVWSWLRSADTTARAFGRPVQVARRSGPAVVETFRAWQGALGWRATTSSWNIVGSHDSARIRTLVGGDSSLHRVAAGLQFTMPGVPMLFAGDELGLEGVTGEDSRRPMPWGSEESWDTSTLAAYAELSRVRRSWAALRRGGQRWAHVDDDTIAFVREHADGSVLVVARRAAGPGFSLRLSLGDHLFGTEPGSPAVDTADDTSAIPASDGPRLDIWTLG